MNIQAEILFKNGKKDWYDPIREEGIIERDGYVLIIGSTGVKYMILKSLIKSIKLIPLCDVCSKVLEENHNCKEEK
jgi:hypothetical protein